MLLPLLTLSTGTNLIFSETKVGKINFISLQRQTHGVIRASTLDKIL